MQRDVKVIKNLICAMAILLVIFYLLGDKLLAGIKSLDNRSAAFEEFEIVRHLQVVQPAAKIPVLTYHHLLKEEENLFFQNNESVISEQKFIEQMNYLGENGFSTISSIELKEFLLNKKSIPAKSIMLTFDDGYQSNYKYAYPILKRHGFNAILFVLSSKIQDTIMEFNADKLTSLSWPEINHSRDVFEYQSHSHSMHFLNVENKSYLITKPRNLIENDLWQSKNILSAKCFSYPYGQYNQQTIELLKRTGYEMAFTNQAGYVTMSTDPYKVPRFSISRSMTLAEFKRIVNGEK